MVRIRFAGSAALAVLALGCVRPERTRRAVDPAALVGSRPNVIIILCDDLGWGDIGPNGNKVIVTPHLNRMAHEGVRLTQFYASGNVCTPSRAGLLTGRLAVRMGLELVSSPQLPIGIPTEEITLAELLKGAGYATACIGKWHLGHLPLYWPTRHGFDYYYGLPYSNDMTPLALYRMEENIEEPVRQETLTERYTAEAIAFIEAHRDSPFFLYLPHTMPHVPLHASPRFAGRSRASLYGDVVETIDWSLGEIMAALKRLGIDDRTLVVFTSDNGPWWEGDAGGLRDRKGSSWDGGMRVPFLARWPGQLPARAISEAIATHLDLLPTVARLAGVSPPTDRPIDGRDITPLLLGSRQSPHPYLVLFNGAEAIAVRTQAWKLVAQSYYRANTANIGRPGYYYHPGLLFDMRSPAPERYNVAREHPEIVAQLAAWLDEARRTIVFEYPSPTGR